MKKSYRVWLALTVGAMLLGSAAYAQPDCVPYCTYSPGGWGAPCNGNNAGCLRDTYFSSVFPNGLTIGREYPGGCCWVHFTSAQAVENFYPEGGTAHVLTANHTNPTSTEAGVFGGQMLALALNVEFSAAGVGGLTPIGNLVINSGAFAGYTVNQLLALGNLVLGGDASALPPGTNIFDLNAAVAAVNLEFDNCTDGTGYIEVPYPVVVVRDNGEALPVHQCLSFMDFQCVTIVWWCQFCNPNDFAVFTYVPGCDGPDCNEVCTPNPGTLSFGTQRIDSTTPGGCWWSTVISASDPGCFCLSLDLQLAADLTAFTVLPGSHQVQLAWITASERDNARFDIERATAHSSWTIIGSVEGQGTSATATHYNFADQNVTDGVLYRYRLVSVDLGGHRQPVGNVESATPSSQVSVPVEFALHQNYPNPFNPTTQIRFDLAEASQVTLNVFDPTGRLVATLVNGNLPADSYEVTFDATSLPTGTYLYRLQAGSFGMVQKMLLLK